MHDAIVTGCSMGAYHALQLAVTRADLFPVALCLSGNYDPSTWRAWGDRGDASYFTNPTDHLAHLGGEHLDWLRSRLYAVLVVGQGAWETHPTGALPSTRHVAAPARREGHPARARPLGPRRRRTTGRGGSSSWRTTSRASARDGSQPRSRSAPVTRLSSRSGTSCQVAPPSRVTWRTMRLPEGVCSASTIRPGRNQPAGNQSATR